MNFVLRQVKLCVSAVVYFLDSIGGVLRTARGMPVRTRGVVLYFHGISRDEVPRFRRQMEMVQIRGRRHAAGLCAAGFRRRCQVEVTFDDGLDSFIDRALPVLRTCMIPATVFVPSGSLGSFPSWMTIDDAQLSSAEKVMTHERLRLLASEPLVTIGAHSVTHQRMTELCDAVAREELQQSKHDLEAIIAKPVELFSFPHGAFDDRLVELALAAGYRQVYTIEPDCTPDGPNAHVVGRVAAHPTDHPLEFFLKIHGAYRWIAALRPLRGRLRDKRPVHGLGSSDPEASAELAGGPPK